MWRYVIYMVNKRIYKKSIISEAIIRHINNNFTEYIVMIILFLIGIILGTMYINNSDLNQRQEVSDYINKFIVNIQDGSKIESNNLLRTSICNNLIITILLWISGLTVIGMPIVYLIVSIKGFFMGYTISAIIATLGTVQGLKFVLSAMLLQNIIIIPSMLVLAVSGIKLYKAIMQDRCRENIKVEIIKYTIIAIFIGITNIIASMIETYISANIFKFIFT